MKSFFAVLFGGFLGTLLGIVIPLVLLLRLLQRFLGLTFEVEVDLGRPQDHLLPRPAIHAGPADKVASRDPTGPAAKSRRAGRPRHPSLSDF